MPPLITIHFGGACSKKTSSKLRIAQSLAVVVEMQALIFTSISPSGLIRCFPRLLQQVVSFLFTSWRDSHSGNLCHRHTLSWGSTGLCCHSSVSCIPELFLAPRHCHYELVSCPSFIRYNRLAFDLSPGSIVWNWRMSVASHINLFPRWMVRQTKRPCIRGPLHWKR